MALLAARAGWDRQCWQLAARCYEPLLAEGALAESVAVCAAGLAAAQRCRDPHAVALMHLACGSAATMTGWLDEALAHYDQALPTFQQMGDERGQARTTLGAGAVHQARRELYAARLCQLAVLETTSIPALTALATGNLGRIALDSGELDEAVRCSTAALRIIDGAGIPALCQVMEVSHDLAEAHLALGDLPAARRHVATALSAANAAADQDMTFTSVHVAVHLTAGRLALVEGQPEDAMREFTRALEMRSNADAHLADLLEGIGQALEVQGQRTAAQAVLHAALSQRRIDGIAYHTASTMAHLAAAYQDQNDTLATELRAEAIAQLRCLADAPSVMLRERLATAA
ncbi:tetratricopeptide repeat protein [Catenulispora sp. GAS73]|uniref:tetratricopeptide repeat protein n=1 Tax=Catenulispora sp. GAS73 TaxID=3156269 RepID=UPI0035169EC7